MSSIIEEVVRIQLEKNRVALCVRVVHCRKVILLLNMLISFPLRSSSFFESKWSNDLQKNLNFNEQYFTFTFLQITLIYRKSLEDSCNLENDV